MSRASLLAFLFLPVAALAGTAVASAAPDTVIIAVSDKAPDLEQFAAKELQRYLQTLFHLQVDITTAGTREARPTFLIGSVENNPWIREVLGADLPALAEQAILLRKLKGTSAPTLVISGGSARAVLWGVYELVARYGVRYLAHGDALPAVPGLFFVPDLDQVLAPNLETRCWRLINVFAMGPESWGLQETDAFVDQLAKMKFNRIHLTLWPWQSFNDFEFHGVRKTTGVSFFGYHFPITPDMVGRSLYGDMTEFENPEFAGAKTYEERLAAARRLARGIIDHGKRRGMDVGITIQPLDFPTEFRSVLPGAQAMKQLGNLTIGPGPDQPIDDPLLADMVATAIRSYTDDYPEADWLNIEVPEHRGWTEQAERVWNILNRQYDLDPQMTFANLTDQARRRTTYAAGDRAVRELKGDITAIYFLDKVIREKHLLQREGRKDLHLVYVGLSEELLRYMPKLLPPQGEVLTFLDYTASQVVKQADVLKRIPARQMPTELIYTVADDNVGVLPQVATSSFHLLNQMLRENGWRGFYTRYWLIGELDPTIHYLSKSSWDSATTPESAYRDLIEPMCGSAAVEPFSLALQSIEVVTTHINREALGFAFPVEEMMLKHYRPGKWQAPPLPAQIERDKELYQQALASIRTARQASSPAGYDFLDYYIGRLVFSVHYLNAVKSVREAGLAVKANQPVEAVRLLDVTLEEMKEGLKAYATVARDNSDRGTIAILNEYAYRSVRKTREDVVTQMRSKP